MKVVARAARIWLAAVIVLAPLGVAQAQPAAAASGSEGGAICHVSYVPVALAPDQPQAYRIFGQLCRPAHRAAKAVQVLVAGTTYGVPYWNFPYHPEHYSYVDAMADAGFATFNMDPIGDGRSSFPPSGQVTLQSSAFTIHQVVQDLRRGLIDDKSFAKVEIVGHSLGSWVTWVETTTYPDDADGVIISGTLHANSASAGGRVNPLFYPAIDDPKFKNSGIDSGYFTSLPGDRGEIYYDLANTDPNVVSVDEALKGTFALGELIQGIGISTSNISLGIHVPVLVVVGDHDIFGCEPDAVDPCTEANVTAHEAPYYSAQACLQVHVIPNTGHVLNLEPTAPRWFDDAADWSNHLVSRSLCS